MVKPAALARVVITLTAFTLPVFYGSATARASRDPAAVYAMPVSRAPSVGPRNALVTLVKAFDFACPHCKRVSSTLEALRKHYGRDLRIVYKHLVVYPARGRTPALASCAADLQGRFHAMYLRIYAHFGLFSVAAMERHARALGLDMSRFRRDMNSRRCVLRLRRHKAELGRLGVRGTPAFFINGRFLAGNRPYSHFAKLIDEELAKARAMVRRGVPARSYYARMVLQRGVKSFTPQPRPRSRYRPRPPYRRYGPDPAAVYSVSILGSPSEGPRYAPVTMVQASEFLCPHCNRVRAKISALRKRYGHNLKVVYKQLVVHPTRATRASLAACAAHRQGQFKAMYDRIFGNYGKLSDSDLDAHAQALGLNLRQFHRDMNGGSCRRRIDRDHREMTALGVRGVPAFFINGRYLGGNQPLSRFTHLIDEELAKARAAMRQGVRLRHYYRRMVIGRGRKKP